MINRQTQKRKMINFKLKNFIVTLLVIIYFTILVFGYLICYTFSDLLNKFDGLVISLTNKEVVLGTLFYLLINSKNIVIAIWLYRQTRGRSERLLWMLIGLVYGFIGVLFFLIFCTLNNRRFLYKSLVIMMIFSLFFYLVFSKTDIVNLLTSLLTDSKNIWINGVIYEILAKARWGIFYLLDIIFAIKFYRYLKEKQERYKLWLVGAMLPFGLIVPIIFIFCDLLSLTEEKVLEYPAREGL